MAIRALHGRALYSAALLLVLTGCPARDGHVVVTPPAPPCAVEYLDLASGENSGQTPAVAVAHAHAALAWLEAGEHQGIHVAVIDLSTGKARLIRDPPEAAPGWRYLHSPQLAATQRGFLLLFSGQEPDGEDAIAVADVALDGTVSELEPALEATGARLAALAGSGDRFHVGWSSWFARETALEVTTFGPGTPAGSTSLGKVGLHPVLRLVPDGDGLLAVWTVPDPEGHVLAATLDRAGKVLAPPRDLGAWGAPSLARLPSGPMVALAAPGGRIWYGPLDGAGSQRGAWVEGRVGALATTASGAIGCRARSTGGLVEEVVCARVTPDGRHADEVVIATEARNVAGLALATDGELGAVAWQQDAVGMRRAVGAAIVRCPAR